MTEKKEITRFCMLGMILILSACVSTTPSISTPIVGTPTMAVPLFPTGNEINCQSISIAPTSSAGELSLFPSVDQKDHIRGPQDADVTIIEYGDFQCPGCSALASELSKLMGSFPSELRFVFRQMPLFDIHDKAMAAAQASEVAGDEGKFWDMYDLLYENHESWISQSPEEFNGWLVDQAELIGLDRNSFNSQLSSPEIVERVESDLKKALEIGLRTTPFLLINGQIYNGPVDYFSLAQIVRLIVLGKHQFTSCPPMEIDPQKQYIATLVTEKGDIIIQLFPEKAPFTVNSFVFLAQNGWYDNNTFYKVIDGLALTGDPSGTGLGGPGYIYDNELGGIGKFDKPGLVAMMNSGLNTNGSQFFITSTPREELNGRFTIFGQVISGLEVLIKLTPRDPGTIADPPPGDLLIKVAIIEK